MFKFKKTDLLLIKEWFSLKTVKIIGGIFLENFLKGTEGQGENQKYPNLVKFINNPKEFNASLP